MHKVLLQTSNWCKEHQRYESTHFHAKDCVGCVGACWVPDFKLLTYLMRGKVELETLQADGDWSEVVRLVKESSE